MTTKMFVDIHIGIYHIQQFTAVQLRQYYKYNVIDKYNSFHFLHSLFLSI
jgi:hypothetical protein